MKISKEATLPSFERKFSFAHGRGGGQVASVLAFYSDNLSSSPADAYTYCLPITIFYLSNLPSIPMAI